MNTTILSSGFYRIITLMTIMLFLAGCQSVYYKAMEKVGIEKRDILVDRVDDAKEAQEEAKQQFESALQQFIATTNYSGGELEAQYNKLKSEYEDSVAVAEDVSERIDSIEHVAEALFAEWKAELDQYTSRELRRSSERKLNETRAQYKTLITTMKRAEKKIQPVLAAFNDRVLYLKHNLNASAIASLRMQKRVVETDIKALIKDMNKSIEEADRFISNMSE